MEFCILQGFIYKYDMVSNHILMSHLVSSLFFQKKCILYRKNQYLFVFMLEMFYDSSLILYFALCFVSFLVHSYALTSIKILYVKYFFKILSHFI